MLPKVKDILLITDCSSTVWPQVGAELRAETSCDCSGHDDRQFSPTAGCRAPFPGWLAPPAGLSS